MGRRANGEGTIYQRNDGRWVASITLEDGKRKSIYCKTQKEAIQAAREANHQKDQGILLSGADQTLNDFLTTWLHDTAKNNVRERTYGRYREIITLHILPILGKVRLQKLKPQQLQMLYNQKLADGYAPQTVRHIHRVLHKALNDAMRWQLVVRNVCDAVRPPRVPKKEMRTLSGEQAQQFLEAAKGDPLEALYVLALTTGMRQGELLGLKWEDIDLAIGLLQVKRTITRLVGKGFTVSEPKTTKSRRRIHLTRLAIEALKQHRIHQREAKLAAGATWNEQGWIFCSAIGGPIEVSNMIRRSFRPILVKANLPIIRFHDLRHSAASLLLILGVHAKVVQELLGHSQISVTLDTYSHVLPSLQEEAVNRLDTLLSRPV
ncbi:tyrosine-type recombinase/integrase [Dictyobacter kobayashii]|uniref:Site-specific integrase n=1 Tax=Dictyobacter kobayashii TaxID=2014872 RepID=A0A402AHI3_9CHLR|nr:tyrosine-type recombinase/integrase [Dictyobacter kobayashii]GCE18578.1 site-specific integrase [Dictyobacter kobayashii]